MYNAEALTWILLISRWAIAHKFVIAGGFSITVGLAAL